MTGEVTGQVLRAVGRDHVVAVLEGEQEDRDEQVRAAAAALGVLLGTSGAAEPLRAASGEAGGESVVRALAAEGVAAAAMSAHGERPVCWHVITRSRVPVLVVPRSVTRPLHRVSRLLLPLDGTPGTAAGVSALATSAMAAGVEVVALHVFDAATAPAFWDQAAHSRPTWSHAFLRRNLPGAARLDLRRGRPTTEVLAGARRPGIDLMVLGWGQDLTAGHAATVRGALLHSPVPVLLVGVPGADTDGPGTFAKGEAGPSSLLPGRREG